MPSQTGRIWEKVKGVWQNNEKNGLKRFRQRTIIYMFGEQNTKRLPEPARNGLKGLPRRLRKG